MATLKLYRDASFSDEITQENPSIFEDVTLGFFSGVINDTKDIYIKKDGITNLHAGLISSVDISGNWVCSFEANTKKSASFDFSVLNEMDTMNRYYKLVVIQNAGGALINLADSFQSGDYIEFSGNPYIINSVSMDILELKETNLQNLKYPTTAIATKLINIDLLEKITLKRSLDSAKLVFGEYQNLSLLFAYDIGA